MVEIDLIVARGKLNQQAKWKSQQPKLKSVSIPLNYIYIY